MSEQTIQDSLYSTPVEFGKYKCLSLGATTIKDLVANNTITGIQPKQSESIKTKKPDVLILNASKEVIVFIEMKKPDALKSKKAQDTAIRQEIDAAKAVKAKIYAISDGNKFIWINPLTEELIVDEDGNPVEEQINPKDRTDEQKKELSDFINEVCFCISDTNNKVLPKNYLDPTALAKNVARILQNITLSTAKNSLYTFVELFTFKFLSDIGVLKGKHSFEHVYRLNGEDGSREAFNYYLTEIRKKLLDLFPPAEDDTTIINGRIFHATLNEKQEPIFAESAGDCFGELLECFKDYEKENGKFIYINKDFKSKLFETFMKNSSEKSGMGQFFTPLKVVQEMVRMVEVKNGMTICDPACGVGKFLLEAASNIPSPYYFENKKLKSNVNLVGFEKRMEDDNADLTAILAKCNMLIYFSDLFKNNCDDTAKITQLSTELLNKVIKSRQTTLGTLEYLEEDRYDLILANPPFYQSAVISKASKTVKYVNAPDKSAYTASGMGVEGLFTEWIVKSIKPGGIANVVLPDGIFTNIGNKNLKKLLRDSCDILSIISLPVGTFFNTPKKTYILTIMKRERKADGKYVKAQKYPVFAYICSSIGETLDTYRFDDPEHNDLHNAVNLYRLYHKCEDDKTVLGLIDKDPRAKLLDITVFDIDSNWNIDNYWSSEEKIALGIKKETKYVSLYEFKEMVLEVREEVLNYAEAIECLKLD